MGIYNKISQINKKNLKNREFKVYKTDDFNDKTERFYNQETQFKKETDIIKEINNGVDYRTDIHSSVQIGTRGSVKYIHSQKNGTGADNILSLPKY
jgi:hypothetical protein